MTADEIIQRMSDQGLRITEQRKSLAQLFADQDRHLTPTDVYEQLGKQYSGLSFDTVYRNLRLLHEINILEQFMFEDGVKFRVRCHEEEHHHHLICLDCEKTVPVVFCPMDHALEVPDDFEIVQHKFEVYGYCNACRQQA